MASTRPKPKPKAKASVAPKPRPVPGMVTEGTAENPVEPKVPVQAVKETKEVAKGSDPKQDLWVIAKDGNLTYLSVIRKAGEEFELVKEKHFIPRLMAWKNRKVVDEGKPVFKKKGHPRTFRKAMQDIV